jgi:uncharacterized protein YdeI (YjbR/CyaY-like superfamily)
MVLWCHAGRREASEDGNHGDIKTPERCISKDQVPPMITGIEDYFSKGCGRCERFATPDCSTRRWEAGLAHLRRLCRDAGLQETVKWGHPCYIAHGRNIALFGAFREDFRLSFFDAALMTDPEGILEKAGPNTRHAGTIRFTQNVQVAALEPQILAYLKEAAGYAKAGIKAPKEPIAIDLPEELVVALDSDPEFAEAFVALTPGRQKSYLIALSSAKTSATRTARIATFRDKVLAGKGATER